MSYFVTLSFDLSNAERSDYDLIKDKLDDLGLYCELEGKTKIIELPNNTFAGEFNGDNTIEVRDYINKNVKEIMKSINVKSTYFINVGTGWSWIKGNT